MLHWDEESLPNPCKLCMQCTKESCGWCGIERAAERKRRRESEAGMMIAIIIFCYSSSYFEWLHVVVVLIACVYAVCTLCVCFAVFVHWTSYHNSKAINQCELPYQWVCLCVVNTHHKWLAILLTASNETFSFTTSIACNSFLWEQNRPHAFVIDFFHPHNMCVCVWALNTWHCTLVIYLHDTIDRSTLPTSDCHT